MKAKVAKWVILGVGILLFALGYASLENHPERMYATKSYGRGIVREKNPVGKGLKTVGLICTGIGGLWVWVDYEENKKK